MKNKLYLFLIFNLLFSVFIHAQDISFQWGGDLPEATLKPKFILGAYEEDIFAISSNFNRYYLHRYNKTTLSLDLYKEFTMPKINESSVDIVKYIQLKDKIIVFYSAYVDKTRKLYVGTLDREGVLTTSSKVYFEIPTAQKGDQVNFYIQASKNEKFIALTVLPPSNSDIVPKNSCQTKVLNTNLEEISQFGFSLSNTIDSKVINYIHGFQIDNDGNVFLLHALGEKNQYKGKLYFALKLSIYSNKDQKVNEQEIDIAQKASSFIGPIAELDSKGNLIVAGLYTSLQGKNRNLVGVEGTFLAKFDISSLELTLVKTNPIPESIRPNLFGVYANKKTEIVPTNLNVDNLIMHEDGSYSILCEYTKSNIFGSIFSTHISNEGAVLNSNVIYKFQSSMGGYSMSYFYGFGPVARNPFLSYLVAYKEGEMAIVFNDHDKNIGKGANYEKGFFNMTAPDVSVPVMLSISKKGEITSRISLRRDVLTTNMKILPALSCKINNQEFIVFAEVDGKEKLGLMKFK